MRQGGRDQTVTVFSARLSADVIGWGARGEAGGREGGSEIRD